MKHACFLCRQRVPDGTCFVRVGKEEHSSCRSCWEQIVLSPVVYLRQLRESHLELRGLLNARA